MFVTLEKIAQTDPKYSEIFLLENYAAFQNRYVLQSQNFYWNIYIYQSQYITCSLYDLANVVPTLAKFYHQASEAYEQACTRHISMIIYYVSHSPQLPPLSLF